MLFGPHAFRSSPAGTDGAFLSTGTTNLLTTGVAAPVGTIAQDANGLLWVKRGTSNTGWVNLSELDGDRIETINPTASVDATFTIPASTDAIRITGPGVFPVGSLGTMRARFNGGAADRELIFDAYDDGTAASAPATARALFGIAADSIQLDLLVLCSSTYLRKMAVGTCGWYQDAAPDLGGVRFCVAHLHSAAALTSFVLRAAVNWQTGSRLTSRRVRLS